MGQRTKIDWCDASWNPVTGCLHGCKYCYARRIAERFEGWTPTEQQKAFNDFVNKECGGADRHVFEHRPVKVCNDGVQRAAPYPFGFAPTFHRYRLNEPQKWKKPRNIFVCSMADLFGDWVPDEWIQEVYEACGKATQHRYLFLTKNPERGMELFSKKIAPPIGTDWLMGYTLDGTQKDEYPRVGGLKSFISIEPLLKPLSPFWETVIPGQAWIIIGAETGNRKGKVVPKKAWIDRIVTLARAGKVPVFMKESLRGIMGDDFVQEFPWEMWEI